MKFDFSLIKEHPYAATGGIVIGGLLLYFVFFSDGSGAESSGTTMVAGSPNDQNDQINAQLQSQQFQLQYLQAQQAGEYASAQLQAQTSTVQQVNAIQGQLAIQGQQISSQTELEKIRLNNEVYLEKMRGDYALQSQVVSQTAALQMTQMQTQANIAINAANVDLQKSIAQYQTSALTSIARYQAGAQVATSSNTWQTVGAIASVAAMFFSDRRLKSNIKRIGDHPLGIGVYEYDLLGVEDRQTGLMADEVIVVRPDAVMVHKPSGLLMVDYAKLAA